MNVTALRLLLWLKLTLGWRVQRSSKLKVLSGVLFVLMLVPIGFIAWGVHWVLGYAPEVLREPIGRDVLAVIYFLWILAPLLGFQVNESYDLTKLFAYPLTFGQIFFGSILGGLIDPAILLAAPPMLAIWLAAPRSMGVDILDALLLLLFAVQAVATSQAVTILLIGLLRSRRFRDITMVIFPLFGLAYYIGQQALVRQFQFVRYGDLQFFTGPVWRAADYLPPGFAVAGMRAAGAADWGALAVDTGGLLISTAVAMAVAAAALRRLFLGEVVAERSSARASNDETAGFLEGRRVPLWMPAEVATLTRKELIYMRRDPQYKAVLVQGLYMVVVIAVPFLLPGSATAWSFAGLNWGADLRMFGVVAALVLATSPLIFNLFGGEGAAVTVLFSFPTPRRRILLAKNLAHATMLLFLNIAGILAVAGLTGGWAGVPLMIGGVMLSIPVLLAGGNLVSIRLPHRMLVRGQRWQRGGGASMGGDSSGCAYAFLYFLAEGVTAVAVAPVWIALILPAFLSAEWGWYCLAIPLAAIYAGVIYAILLRVAETWLTGREPEIAAAVIPPD